MPHVRLNRTGGARRGMTYVGISERSFSDDHERLERRAYNKKKALIRRAKLLAKSEDWKAAGQEFAELHKRWKAAGSAGREQDEKLWTRFRAPTAEFRERRQKHFAELNRLAREKASLKQQLIAEAERLGTAADYRQANGQFKDLMVRWRETGHAGNLENGLWERFSAARQAMYDATAQDRRSLQSEYVQRVANRIQRHREVIGKLRSLRRELTIRRQGVIPGWVGIEMVEEFDERIAEIEESLVAREEWLEQDVEKLNQAQARVTA
jgi:Domain of Unknown Function (DUF349)